MKRILFQVALIVAVLAFAGYASTQINPVPADAITQRSFVNLGTPPNGVIYFCPDCAATSPCADSGTGAFAYRVAGAWNCNSNGAGSQILVADGTVTAPGWSWTSNPAIGLRKSGNAVYWVRASNNRMSFEHTFGEDLTLPSGGVYGMTSVANDAANAPDTMWTRGGAATWQAGRNASTGTANTIKAANSTGSNIAGPSLTVTGGNGTSGNADGGALILQGGALAGGGAAGVVRIGDIGTKPTCAAGIRGAIWYDGNGAGVADTMEVCAKASTDTYAWRAMATIP